MGYPSLLPLLICKLPLQLWKIWLSWPAIPLVNCLLPGAYTPVLELLTYISTEKRLSTRMECLHPCPSALNLTDTFHFQILRSTPVAPIPFSQIVSYIYNMLYSLTTAWMPSGLPKPLNDLFYHFAYIKVQSLNCKAPWVLINV